jgi:hypothetical protein
MEGGKSKEYGIVIMWVTGGSENFSHVTEMYWAKTSFMNLDPEVADL